VYFIAVNPHLIESKDCESSSIQTGSILNSILGAHWLLFVTSAHSREAGSPKDRQPGLPGIGGEPDGPVCQESMVKRLKVNLNSETFNSSCNSIYHLTHDHGKLSDRLRYHQLTMESEILDLETFPNIDIYNTKKYLAANPFIDC
jgi:hypothetical protein